MTPTDASLLTAEHLRTLADRLDRNVYPGLNSGDFQGGADAALNS